VQRRTAKHHHHRKVSWRMSPRKEMRRGRRRRGWGLKERGGKLKRLILQMKRFELHG